MTELDTVKYPHSNHTTKQNNRHWICFRDLVQHEKGYITPCLCEMIEREPAYRHKVRTTTPQVNNSFQKNFVSSGFETQSSGCDGHEKETRGALSTEPRKPPQLTVLAHDAQHFCTSKPLSSQYNTRYSPPLISVSFVWMFQLFSFYFTFFRHDYINYQMWTEYSSKYFHTSERDSLINNVNPPLQ